MAQVPWRILDSRTLTVAQACAFMAGATRALARLSAGIADHENTLSQIQTIQQSVQEDVTAGAGAQESNFRRLRLGGVAQLHPCFMRTAEQGFNHFLAPFLLRYVPELQGLWVCYQRPRSGQQGSAHGVGHVPCGEAWGIISVKLEVDCLVFCPNPGTLLVGVVNQVRPTHIGLLVHGLFNACVKKHKLQKRFEYDEDTKIFVSKSRKGPSIKQGVFVATRVSRYHYSSTGEIMTIEGAVDDVKITGVVDRTGQIVEDSGEDSAKRKRQTTPEGGSSATRGKGSESGERPRKAVRKDATPTSDSAKGAKTSKRSSEPSKAHDVVTSAGKATDARKHSARSAKVKEEPTVNGKGGKGENSRGESGSRSKSKLVVPS